MSFLLASISVALITPHIEGPLLYVRASSDPPPVGDSTSAWTGTAAFSQEREDRWTAVYWIGAYTEELNWAS